jgi:hypothetical protein
LPQPAFISGSKFLLAPFTQGARGRPNSAYSPALPEPAGLAEWNGSPVSGTAQYLRMLAMTFGMVAMMSGSGSQGVG